MSVKDGSLNPALPNADPQEPRQNEVLTKLMEGMAKLPSAPALYFELLHLLHNPDVGLPEIAAVIDRDMAMTAIILKVANSAEFGLGGCVGNTTEAMVHLGVETVRTLVLSVHAFSAFEPMHVKGFSEQALWNHSLETATTAKAIALLENTTQEILDASFVAGMLHDIGKLVIAANFPAEFEKVVRLTQSDSLDFCMAEEEVFGFNHSAIGGYLLGSWKLPVSIVEAVSAHHNPAQLEQREFGVLTAVHVGNALIHESRPDGHSTSAALDMAYLEKLGLADRVAAWRDIVAARRVTTK